MSAAALIVWLVNRPAPPSGGGKGDGDLPPIDGGKNPPPPEQ
jgi:hypothetical protein